MGALRTAIDNLNATLNGAALRSACAALRADWPTVFDGIVTDITVQRAALPNNDNLLSLTPAQCHALDVAISGILNRLAFVDAQGNNTDITTPFPSDQFYDFVDAVGTVRDALRARAGFA